VSCRSSCLGEFPNKVSQYPSKQTRYTTYNVVYDRTVEQPENKFPDPLPKAQEVFRLRFRLYRSRSRGSGDQSAVTIYSNTISPYFAEPKVWERP
jgi:hypothetical protein